MKIKAVAIAALLVGCAPSTPDDYNLLNVDEQADAEAYRVYGAGMGLPSATYAKTRLTVQDFETALRTAKSSPSRFKDSVPIAYGELAVGARLVGFSSDKVKKMLDDPEAYAEEWYQLGTSGAAELYRRCKLASRCEEL